MSGETKQRISELEAEIARLKEAQPTLRDQFAMAALTGLLASENASTYAHSIYESYSIANRMMEVRDDKQD